MRVAVFGNPGCSNRSRGEKENCAKPVPDFQAARLVKTANNYVLLTPGAMHLLCDIQVLVVAWLVAPWYVLPTQPHAGLEFPQNSNAQLAHWKLFRGLAKEVSFQVPWFALICR